MLGKNKNPGEKLFLCINPSDKYVNHYIAVNWCIGVYSEHIFFHSTRNKELFFSGDTGPSGEAGKPGGKDQKGPEGKKGLHGPKGNSFVFIIVPFSRRFVQGSFNQIMHP